jgi:CheY-like chemotaxis protein
LKRAVKILIADDSAEMRRCIREFLSSKDKILECASGREAVAVFNTNRPDWVLMDIEMPEQDGFSAAREIRAAYPEARIVFVTAHDELRVRTVASQLGQGFVLKTRLQEIQPLLDTSRNETKSA